MLLFAYGDVLWAWLWFVWFGCLRFRVVVWLFVVLFISVYCWWVCRVWLWLCGWQGCVLGLILACGFVVVVVGWWFTGGVCVLIVCGLVFVVVLICA